jgi:23S rRNA pseudouridine955/2504/2580 synthase
MHVAKAAGRASVEYRQVDAAHVGQRLDNFLISSLKGVPRSHIYRILRRGEVRINRGRQDADYRLKLGDVVRIPPLRRPPAPPALPLERASTLAERILYEDEDLIVIDKPAGLAVHGGSGIALGLIERLRALRPRVRRLELVHRLDRETSGCLLVAKNRAALLALHAQLRAGEVDKRYDALVRGQLGGSDQEIRAPLQKYRLRSGERMVEVSGEGKEALTHLTPKDLFPDATLVEIQLLTGRTHQARVHAAHSGHPVAGDGKYGDREFNQRMRKLGLRRLFLHARRLRFKHPSSGARMTITAPLPPDLTAFLRRLQDVAPV